MLLSGEPGIRKLRLATAVQEHLQGEAQVCLRFFCSANQIDSAFHPVIRHLEHAAGFERDDTPQTKLDKLTMLLPLASTEAPIRGR